LGARGLRANVGYARTSYDLRAPFEDYSGTAKVANAGVSYQLLRSRQTNLSLSAGYRYKDLDTQLLGFSIDAKSSRAWPLGLNFDRRDELGGGGVTWLALEVVPGRLDADNAGAIDGSFTRSHLQAARIQNLPGRMSMLTRVSGQWANRDLDSSESFVLGGAGGVRAYPQGEAAGSEGWLGQLELRYTVGNATPFVFYDSGRIDADAMQASRRISGAGVGVRYQHNGIFLDLATAWRSTGGQPQSDDRTRSPRAWMSLSYAFRSAAGTRWRVPAQRPTQAESCSGGRRSNVCVMDSRLECSRTNDTATLQLKRRRSSCLPLPLHPRVAPAPAGDLLAREQAAAHPFGFQVTKRQLAVRARLAGLVARPRARVDIFVVMHVTKCLGLRVLRIENLLGTGHTSGHAADHRHEHRQRSHTSQFDDISTRTHFHA
jgi:hypothetical protein